MFSKSNKPATKANAPRVSVTPSLISHGLEITGDMKCDGEIQIDGSITGDVDCQKLIIGEKAVIKGEVIADVIVVRGEIQGRVRGREVSLARSARVIGDVFHQSLAMEAGAHLEGQVRKVDDPRQQVATNIPKLLQTGGAVRDVERKLGGDAVAGA